MYIAVLWCIKLVTLMVWKPWLFLIISVTLVSGHRWLQDAEIETWSESDAN
jgi:hypothetical protein